jgi:hypothetical protein
MLSEDAIGGVRDQSDFDAPEVNTVRPGTLTSDELVGKPFWIQIALLDQSSDV